MIKLSDVSFSYGDRRVLDRYSLTISSGERVYLRGASGCGKTTLLRLIAGLIAPSSGTVEVDGRVSMLFQENRLVPNLSVRDNVLLVGADTRLLAELGLADIERKKPGELSGGMARRVALARALGYGGNILLLDEPFTGLDLANKRAVARAVNKYFAGKTVMTVCHNEEDIELLGGREVVLPDLRICAKE